LSQLFFPGAIYQTPEDWLSQYPKYCRAILLRLEKLNLNPQKDKLCMAEVAEHWQRYAAFLEKEGKHQLAQNSALMEYRWWIEEFRVSLFAQTLKTQVSVSAKRLDKQWELVLAFGG
jgi:ATP-dependent helicase HrpA